MVNQLLNQWRNCLKRQVPGFRPFRQGCGLMRSQAEKPGAGRLGIPLFIPDGTVYEQRSHHSRSGLLQIQGDRGGWSEAKIP